MNLFRASLLYSATSVVIGPAIPLLANKLFPLSIACFDVNPGADTQYTEISSIPIPTYKVAQEYQAHSLFLIVCTAIMIAIGVALLALIVRRKRPLPLKQTLIATTLIALMFAGYSLILGYAWLALICAP